MSGTKHQLNHSIQDEPLKKKLKKAVNHITPNEILFPNNPIKFTHIEQFDNNILFKIFSFLNLKMMVILFRINFFFNSVISIYPIKLHDWIKFTFADGDANDYDDEYCINGNKLIENMLDYEDQFHISPIRANVYPHLLITKCSLTFCSTNFTLRNFMKYFNKCHWNIKSLEITHVEWTTKKDEKKSSKQRKANNQQNKIFNLIMNGINSFNTEIILNGIGYLWHPGLCKIINSCNELSCNECHLRKPFWINLRTNLRTLTINGCVLSEDLSDININSIEKLQIEHIHHYRWESTKTNEIIEMLISKTIHTFKLDYMGELSIKIFKQLKINKIQVLQIPLNEQLLMNIMPKLEKQLKSVTLVLDKRFFIQQRQLFNVMKIKLLSKYTEKVDLKWNSLYH